MQPLFSELVLLKNCSLRSICSEKCFLPDSIKEQTASLRSDATNMQVYFWKVLRGTMTNFGCPRSRECRAAAATFCVANESLLDHLAREFITHLTFGCCKLQSFLFQSLMIILPNLACSRIIFYPMLPIILSLIIQVSFASQGKAQCLKITQKSHSKWRAKRATFTF